MPILLLVSTLIWDPRPCNSSHLIGEVL